ncbi:hypothetical protein [Ruania alba]|uniref:Uncharacterized protein n=1 Tax=Ruania alba TaxID=648782 RepID=A0A1H5DTB2_9MICO|nr:hypothetical protein [Ruania alba]SED82103.1 hypothetical protein SAMN04488554_0786 [Ruania alba]
MADDSTLLRAVRSLKPDVPPVDEAESRALLNQVNARIAASAATADEVAELTPRQPPVAARRMLAGAAAAALLAVGVVTLTDDGGAPAYADWSPVPTELRPAEMDEITSICPDQFFGAPEDQDAPEVTPVLAERRGEHQILLSASEAGAYQYCVLLPDPGSDLGYRPHIESFDPGTSAPPQPSDSTGVYSAFTGEPWAPSPDHGAMTVFLGTVGEDVDAVELHTENGSFAEASVMEGWFLVWFPDAVQLSDTATVTTDDGDEVEVTIEGPGS